MPKQLLLFFALLVFAVSNSNSQNNAFISTWNTGADGSVTIPVQGAYLSNYHVVVKNANTSLVVAEQDVIGSFSNTDLPANTEVTVAITGDFPAIYMSASNFPKRLLSVDQWGSIQWKSMEKAFYDCSNLDIKATDTPDLSQVSSMQYMFSGAANLKGDLSQWNVSNVTNMKGTFFGATNFNGNISGWDVSKVTDMHAMFFGDEKFNVDLSSWKVSSVVDMSHMFYNATSFNSNLSSWDVSSVDNMTGMFYNCKNFNSNISSWKVDQVAYTSYMFYGASNFSADLSNWKISKVSNMTGMFQKASSFNSDLSSWDVSKVVNMSHMFSGAEQFTGDISGWNVSNVSDMAEMFKDATSFDGDLSSWNVGKVSDMSSMFYQATSFTGNLSAWSAKADVLRGSMFTGAGDTFYTITYHVDGKKYLGFYPATHNKIILRALAAKNGKAFYGWNTLEDLLGDVLIDINEGQIGNVDLYAHWSTSTSVDDETVSTVSYYPNPVLNKLNISGLEGEYTAGKLFNTAGVIVYRFKLTFSDNEYFVDMSDYAPGVYLLQLKKSSGTTESYKLIKK